MNVHGHFIYNSQKLEIIWLTKLWYIQATEYQPAIKRNKLLTDLTTWKVLKGIMLGEEIQTLEVKYHRIPCIQNSLNNKMIKWGTAQRSEEQECKRKAAVTIKGSAQGILVRTALCVDSGGGHLQPHTTILNTPAQV